MKTIGPLKVSNMTGSNVFIILLLVYHSKGQINSCRKTFQTVKDSVLILSNDQRIANTAQKKCSLLGGNLAMTDDPQINATLTQLMTDKYTTDLQRIYVFYKTRYQQYKYSKSPVKNGIWNSTKYLGHLWYFDLYKSNQQNSSKPIYFCDTWRNQPKYNWKVTVGKTCKGKGWKLRYTLFADNTRKRQKRIFIYVGRQNAYKLRSVNESYGNFAKYKRSFRTPNINVIIGARYNTSLNGWYWSDGSPANFPVSNVTTCQQGALHYGIGWEQSSMNCSGEAAYYACQVKFVTNATTFECNASTVVVSWSGLDQFINKNGLIAKVEVYTPAMKEKIYVWYSNKSATIRRLAHSTVNIIQVTVIVNGSINANITSNLTVKTPGNPPSNCYPKANLNATTSVGIIAGLVIGLLFLVLVIGALVIMFLRRKHRLGTDQPSHAGVQQSLRLGILAPQVENQVHEDPFSETAASNCRVSKLFDLYKKNVESGSCFSNEFKKIENQSKNNERTRDVSQLPQNAVRNRYKNIFPYDHARVVLQGSGGNDYINAAYIPGYDNERKFIATQGPKKETINDFWLMVWQENSNIIVMLTGLRENGKSKCEQYWPDVESERKLSPGLTVRTQLEITIGGIVQRQFVLFINREQRTITQLQFTTWPDHGIPVTTSNMIHLRNMVDDLQNTNAPIIVHCSAGVGRTGTYIAMDTLFHELDDKGKIDVPRAVLRMRENRKDMIQNSKQYMYVYKLLMERESLMKTDKDVTELQTMTTSEIKKMQDKEFNTLSSWRFGEEWQENHPQLRTYKNTSVKVFDKKNESMQQLDASYIQQHDSSDLIIAARNPAPGEEENFWKMIVERGASLVVDLDNSIQIPTNAALQYEDISVSVREVNNFNVHNLITVNVWSATNAFAAQQVMLLQVMGWSDVEQPPKEMDLIKIIEEMQRQKSKQNCKCVLVACSNGSTRTGNFIALVSILERLKVQKRVDVFRTVKDLRDMRPNMVDNKVLYKYCHSVVMQYLSDFDTYSNFK